MGTDFPFQPITTKEVKDAVYSIKGEKSPSPDAFSTKFYKLHWELIQDELTSAFKYLYATTDIPKGLNHTFITLVPKINKPAHISDYRLIACCSVLYKILSKVICKRLMGLRPFLIPESQCVFIAGRNIIESIFFGT